MVFPSPSTLQNAICWLASPSLLVCSPANPTPNLHFTPRETRSRHQGFAPAGTASRRFGLYALHSKFASTLPLFASDDMLGALVLGPDRAREWKQIVPLLEARGLPQVDQLMGGRYVPAVRAFFDHQHGLDRSGAPPLSPDGVEDFAGWRGKQKRRA